MSREAVIESMRPLFERADREGLWFYMNYQGIWISPDELRAAHAGDRFLWGAVNWELRDPEELIKDLRAGLNSSQQALTSAQERITKWKASRA